VNCGAYDSTDALLFYNYLDQTADFVRSIPLQVNLPEGKGTIRIESLMSSRKPTKLPEHLKDLSFYIPPMWKTVESNIANLGYLMIPPDRAPYSMRRVLELAVGKLGADLSDEQMNANVRFAEKCVIDVNLNYINELRTYMEKYDARPPVEGIANNIRDLATLQLDNIDHYAFVDRML
jgi:hypothetical protein